MPKKQEIEITILPDGRVEYTVVGVKGAHCADIAELLKVLGQVEQEQNTGEYYESERSGDVVIRH